ncbi:hypothetical protein [Streptomyces sp. NPDC058457]|uniref:hypothetical protein n=1 Tax=Streptomyces sp. NPDC058457 TaxID=3346507 RepID=UPI00364B6349
MCRTVRALSVAVLAGAAFGATGTAVAAAGPAAEISPGSARPGATVIVSVTCEKADGRGTGQAPSVIDATSSAFAGRTVRLARVDQGGGLVYRGTAQVVSGDGPVSYTEGDAATGDVVGGAASAGHAGTWTVDGTCPAVSQAQARPWTAHLAVAPVDGGTASAGDGGTVLQGGGGAMPEVGGGVVPQVDGGTVFQGDGGTAPHGDAGVITGGDDGTASRGDDGMFTRGDGGGTAPRGDEGTAARGDDGAASRGDDGQASRGDDGTASRGDDGAVFRGDGDAGRPCTGGQQSCGGGDRQECGGGAHGGDGSCAVAGVQHGVEAGDGGAYDTSVAALVAGGMLIAAACCGAAYRVWGGRPYRLWSGRSGADG